MRKKIWLCLAVAVAVWAVPAGGAFALSQDRWTDDTPYGVFFNDYDPNFYTGFAPRVQERERIAIHLGRGNQLRVRMVLSDATIANYLPDQAARYDMYRELIEKKIITLTANRAWEAYHEKVAAIKLHELAAGRDKMAADAWRDLNLEWMNRLVPGRLFHIRKDFRSLMDGFAETLTAGPVPDTLDARLDRINTLMSYRLFAYDLTPDQTTALSELTTLAGSGPAEAFRAKAGAFFHDITGGIYPVKNGFLDFYELTTIYPAGTLDATIVYKSRTIPQYPTPGVWPLIPRDHGKGFLGMVDYISSAGYYGLMPMLPYEYGGGGYYNAIHNTGISNWITGHALLPESWRLYTGGSRNGKPYNRVAITSRGPVSHGCTRLSSGHLTELREMLPSTSEGMKGIVHYRNLSHCYDVFDPKGDGEARVMGVQYYFAFRHTDSRVANQIWVQNNRKDFYGWLYGDEIAYGPVGEVSFKEAWDGKFVKRKAVQGKRYQNIGLYEAPYEPEYLQFYTINGVDKLSEPGMNFNRELRRVGYGYRPDRRRLMLE